MNDYFYSLEMCLQDHAPGFHLVFDLYEALRSLPDENNQ